MALFRRRLTAGPSTELPDPSETHAADFAWKVHGAQEAWASKSDVKASILLALEGGALFAVVSAHAKGGFLAELVGWRRLVELAGLAILLLAVSAATIAVLPRLGSADTHRENYRRQLIFFGHLRFWEPADLKIRIETLTLDEELDALSQQLVEMARKNWYKHRWLQISLLLALSGVIITSVAAAAVL